MNAQSSPDASHNSADPTDVRAFDAVVGFDGMRARVTGPTGSGKTSALLARATRLALRGEATLFIAAPSAVAHVRTAASSASTLGDADISVHSWQSFASAVYLGHGGDRHVINRTTEEEILGALLGLPGDSAVTQRFIGARRAYVESWLGAEELATHALAAGVAQRWAELHDISEEFSRYCEERSLIDPSTLLIEATYALRSDVHRWRSSYPHVVLDDFESATFAHYRLGLTLAGFVGPGTTGSGNSAPSVSSLVVAGNLDGPHWDGPGGSPWLAAADRRFQVDADFALPPAVKADRPEKSVEAIHVRHRSLRGAAIVAEVTKFLDQGFGADQIAIIVPPGQVGRDTGRSIALASARRQLRVRRNELISNDPVASAVADAALSILTSSPWPESIRALGIAEPPWSFTNNPDAASMVFSLWQELAPRILQIGTSEEPATQPRTRAPRTEALRALHLETRRSIDQGFSAVEAVDRARRRYFRTTGGLEIVTDTEARGRRWPIVFVTGFEEGVRPPQPRPIDYFDPDLLGGPDVPDQNERHHLALVESRRRTENLLARGEVHALAVSAPEPGVLPSRFIEELDTRPAAFDATNRRSVQSLATTHNERGFWDERRVRASASSLDTFRNCPLEYTYKYVLNIATGSGAQAMVGNITHDVLEAFFDPTNADRSPERLREIFERRWSDDDFDYLAQASEYRAAILSMLDNVLQRESEVASNVHSVERPFSIPLGEYTLTGKIDRIDVLPASASETETETETESTRGLSIIDYKTGKSKRNAGEESLQLGVYYLAAKHDPELVEVGEPRELALYFLKEDRLDPQRVHPQLEEQWTEIILDTLARIASGEHQPSAEASCEYCSFGRVCPTQPEGRFVHIPTPVVVRRKPARVDK